MKTKKKEKNKKKEVAVIMKINMKKRVAEEEVKENQAMKKKITIMIRKTKVIDPVEKINIQRAEEVIHEVAVQHMKEKVRTENNHLLSFLIRFNNNSYCSSSSSNSSNNSISYNSSSSNY